MSDPKFKVYKPGKVTHQRKRGGKPSSKFKIESDPAVLEKWAGNALMQEGLSRAAKGEIIDQTKGASSQNQSASQTFVATAKNQTPLDMELFKLNQKSRSNWGYLTAVRELLEQGANPNAVTADGSTLLHWIAQNGNKPVAELLLSKGVLPDEKNVLGQTPLYWAVENSDHEIAELLIKHGANVNFQTTPKQGAWTLLHFAIKNNNRTILKLLLDNGANPNLQDAEGNTPLHIAAKDGMAEMVEDLLNHDADPTICNNSHDHWKPVQYAAHSGWENIVKLLLKWELMRDGIK